MKLLKVILNIIYPILILLLLLANNRCQGTGTVEASDSRNVIREEEATDSANIVRQARETGGSGNLKITLLWSFQGDIDLHVTQPNDSTIYWRRPKDSVTGGFLDVDNRLGGVESAENIFWETPPMGEYIVSLVYYGPSESSNVAESGICSVVVFQDGKTPLTYKVKMANVKEEKIVTRIIL